MVWPDKTLNNTYIYIFFLTFCSEDNTAHLDVSFRSFFFFNICSLYFLLGLESSSHTLFVVEGTTME